MSGGHYNYAYFKFYELSELIQEDLDDPEANLRDETKDLMKKFKAELIHTAKKAKSLEWFMSGDTSSDDFKKAMEEPFNPNITESDVWR